MREDHRGSGQTSERLGLNRKRGASCCSNHDLRANCFLAMKSHTVGAESAKDVNSGASCCSCKDVTVGRMKVTSNPPSSSHARYWDSDFPIGSRSEGGPRLARSTRRLEEGAKWAIGENAVEGQLEAKPRYQGPRGSCRAHVGGRVMEGRPLTEDGPARIQAGTT